MAVIKRSEHESSHRVLGRVKVAIYASESQEAVVLFFGNPVPRADLPVRIQSSCVYGDALSISDCDCRQQLEDTYGRFLESRRGILIFVREEGYGGGLIAQGQSVRLSRTDSVDPIEAYRQVGVRPEKAEYSLAIEVLRDIGADTFSLLTNNGRKLEAMTAAGLAATREPLPVRPTEDNLAFLEAKQTQLDQPLGLTPPTEQQQDFNCFVIGAATMDHVLELRHNPSIGKARQASRYRRRPGGKAFNQAVALSRLGARTTLLTVRGSDADSAEISNVLAMERVRDEHTRTPHDLRTPQTVVFQPAGHPPTYVGWLGAEHRTLRRQIIGQFQTQIQAADAVMVTLEASEDAVHHAVRLAQANSLVVLSASPIVEAPYEVGTEALEHTDVIVGSREELAALIPNHRSRRASDAENELQIAQHLAHLCGTTVVLTSFRSVRRWALAVNPHIVPVRVFAADVRQAGVSDAIGTTDVFCAGLALQMLRLPEASNLPRVTGIWRGPESPLAHREYVTDALVKALSSEAYVARSKGGYKTFPRWGEEFELWSRLHPPEVESEQATRAAFGGFGA